MPDEPTTGAPSNEHPDATWVDSFLLTRPGKTFQVEITEDGHQAAAREAVESVGRDFTDDIVRRSEHDEADNDTEAAPTEQN